MKKFYPFVIIVLFIEACMPVRSVVNNLPKIRTSKIFPQAVVQPDTRPFLFYEQIDTAFGNKFSMSNLFHLFDQTQFETVLKENKTRAFLVIHRDTILYEKYFKGRNPSSYLTSFSMAKSFVSTLIGIALQEGKITSVKDPFCKYFSDIDCEKFGNVTIEHLLQHTSGIRYRGLPMLYYGKNLGKKVLPKSINYPPGTHFKYENANSQILGMLLENVYHQPIYELWQEKVWSKIGTEYPLYWAMDDKKHQQAKTFCCIDATARDFARLGRVWMNGGKYGDLQIIPQEWMAQVQSPSIENGAAINYKYHFWRAPSAYHCFLAAGMYGQIVFMCPERELMFIRLGEKTKVDMDDKFWIPIFLQLMDQMELEGYFGDGL